MVFASFAWLNVYYMMRNNIRMNVSVLLFIVVNNFESILRSPYSSYERFLGDHPHQKIYRRLTYRYRHFSPYPNQSYFSCSYDPPMGFFSVNVCNICSHVSIFIRKKDDTIPAFLSLLKTT